MCILFKMFVKINSFLFVKLLQLSRGRWGGQRRRRSKRVKGRLLTGDASV